MQIDRSPFSFNKLDLENPAVLIWLKQADMPKGKNAVIDDPRPKNDAGLTPSRKVVMEKLPDGEETITITIRGSRAGQTTTIDGQTTLHQNRAPRMIKPRGPEASEWMVNEGRNKKITFKPTFDYFPNKDTKDGPKD
jgi:hypothetical protein